MKWERRVEDQRQGFDFCFEQRRHQKIPPAECRQKSYRNCGCNLASIGQPHPLSHNGQLRVSDRHSSQLQGIQSKRRLGTIVVKHISFTTTKSFIRGYRFTTVDHNSTLDRDRSLQIAEIGEGRIRFALRDDLCKFLIAWG
ncbi:hypothetical protein T06_8296 [Trichinella sp. T6]|nr:hypothetical protein T06_8296 [Trichinella sp. T6]